jgi:hypothetical protein
MIGTGSDGLRTFSLARPDICAMPVAGIGLDNIVNGILEHKDGAPEPVMLRDDDGADLSVVWPQGFHVQFAPEATLLDEQGHVFARAGDRVVLDGTQPSVWGGEYAYPYIAHMVDGKCYSFALDSANLPPATP